MRAGRVEEAQRVRSDKITRRIKLQLEQIDGKSDTKELWKAVRQLTERENAPAASQHHGRQQSQQSLRQRYTDVSYERRYRKSLLQNAEVCCTMFRRIFEYWRLISDQQPLDSTNCQSGSLDWRSTRFLRSRFPDQLVSAYVDGSETEWKQARIRPFRKRRSSTPQQVVDYQPISIAQLCD